MENFLKDMPAPGELLSMAIQAVLVLAIGFIIMKLLLKVLKEGLKRSKLDESLHSFIITCAKVFMWILIIITILGALDVPIATFVAVLGAAGAAIALALKDSLGNVAGGVLILIHTPFKKGDCIDDGNVLGNVENVGLFYTTLRTLDNTIITIPNGQLANDTVKNYSKEPLRRVDCNFGVSYNADLLKAKAILQEVAEKNPLVLKDPAVYVGVEEHGESAVVFHVRSWTNTENYWTVMDQIKEAAKLALDAEGISIPFPQVDVHIQK